MPTYVPPHLRQKHEDAAKSENAKAESAPAKSEDTRSREWDDQRGGKGKGKSNRNGRSGGGGGGRDRDYYRGQGYSGRGNYNQDYRSSRNGRDNRYDRDSYDRDSRYDNSEYGQHSQEKQSTEDARYESQDVRYQESSRDSQKNEDSQDVRYNEDTQGVRYAQGSQDVRYAQGSQDIRYSQDTQDVRSAQGSQDIRYSQDTQDGRYSQGSQDVRYSQGSQDIRYQQDSQDVRYQNTQDVRYQNSQDVRYSQDGYSNHRKGGGRNQQQGGKEDSKSKGRNRGGKNRSRGGGGGGGGDKGNKGEKEKNGDATDKVANGAEVDSTNADGEPTDVQAANSAEAGTGTEGKKSGRSRGGRNRNGGGGGGNDNEADSATHALSNKIRKLCMEYEEKQETEYLQQAYELLSNSVAAGEGACDAAAFQSLLLAWTRNGQLGKCQKLIDIMVEHKVYLDASHIVAMACAVTQRGQSHKGLNYLRRLIYGCLPESFGKDESVFFDRHASFIYSELMAEADSCVGRMENRDTSILVGLGFTELGIEMDWENSTANAYTLFNRVGEKGKKVYQPTVQQGGFMRTDVLLLSYDIGHPDVAKKLPRDYDRLQCGAEVEVIGSAAGESKTLAPLVVKLLSPPKEPFEENMVYRLDSLASRDQTRRMLDAIKVVLWSPSMGSPLQPAPQLRELILVPNDQTLTKVGKKDLPLELMNYNEERQAGLDSFRRDIDRYKSLNKSQLDALSFACTRRISLIQGPPGTGKTTTAVQIVSALVQYGLTDLPILVTADSNTAVDNLVRGIAKDGLNVVRVGRPDSIRDDVKQYSLDGRWKELKKAEVICATCIGSSGSTLEKVRFATVLIDECTQAAESAALVPIARGCQQAILIGDQCQLPPTVLSDVAQTENLGESLFTRLVTQGVRPTMLDTQYRMNPLICEFASAAFYNGRLQNGVSHYNRRPPEGFPWPNRQMPVAFVNLPKSEEVREGSSYINPVEAEKALWALQEVCKNPEIKPEDVGIVTPYKGQVNFIKRLIRERPGLQAFRTGLEVESVDGFQGEEKAVIIFCAVRSNRDGKVGFLSDWRRLNVMLTRAKRGCIIIGNRGTLVSDPLWKEWLLWATARGAICGEGAKGSWQPRYLVDDRDGMWAVKADIMGEAPLVPGIGDAGAGAMDLPAADAKEEPMDSWEDLLDSPAQSPTSGPAPEPSSLKDKQAAALGA